MESVALWQYPFDIVVKIYWRVYAFNKDTKVICFIFV